MPAVPPKAAQRRSVLLISIDTLRADRVGRTPSLTPTIDALAARGAFYAQARCSVPLTLPSHSVLMTGLYPFDLGVRDNGTFKLDLRFETLAEMLGSAGYRTGAVIGAYVLNHRFGLSQGFDSYDDAIPDRGQVLLTPERRASEVVDRARAWLSEDLSRPFFLFVHVFDPHAAYVAPEPWASRLKDPYDAEVAYADAEVGRLLALLDEKAVKDKVIVVLLSDHGESLGEHGEKTHGLFLYDATLRVPLVIAAPSQIPAGTRFAGVARLVDVVPTVLSLLGLPPKQGLRGRSLWPLPTGADADSYAETLFPFLNLRWSGSHALLRAHRKLVLSARPELYDLAADPGELHPAGDSGATDLRDDLLALLGKDPLSPESVEPEVGEKLRSLGYLSGQASSKGSALDDRLKLPDPKDRVELFASYDEAISKLHAGDYAGGIALLERILDQDPGSVMALSFLGAAAFEAKDLTRSEAAYRDALRQEPDRADLEAELGRTLAQSGRIDDALAMLGKAIAVDPKSAMAFFVKGQILERKGDLRQAHAALSSAHELDSESSSIAVELAGVLLKQGEDAAARGLVDASLSTNPADARCLALRGLLRARAHDPAGARSDFESALGIAPGNPQALVGLATAEAQMGDLPKAISHFEAALAAADQPAEVHNAFAFALLQAGHADRAKGELQKSLELRPDQPQVAELLSRVSAAP